MEKNSIIDNQEQYHGFCENPDTKCSMSYCDDNGCVERKREPVLPTDPEWEAYEELRKQEAEADKELSDARPTSKHCPIPVDEEFIEYDDEDPFVGYIKTK